jgi:arylsulfatase A-like enzyme
VTWWRLGPLAVAGLVIVSPGCDDRADVHRATRSPTPAIRLARSGVSQDLLCALSVPRPRPVPDRLAKAPSACSCGRATPTCRIVDRGDDRRRSLVLAPGDVATATVRASREAQLRFSIGVVGPRPTALDVSVAAVDSAGGASRTWTRRIGVADRWVDVAMELPPIGDRTVEIRFAVGSDPGTATQARIALAAPRLVVPTHAGDAPTNVLVYLIDTLRADHTSAYGYARPTTPRLAELARSGLLFENAYSVASWTRPAVASLLTGLYPGSHGVHARTGLPAEVATLAERFRAGGWSTWAFVANGHVHGETLNFEQGFDRFVALRGRHLDNHARTEEINERLLPQLVRGADEPFLVYVHAVDPHSPYDPPESHRGRFTDAGYHGEIRPHETTKRFLRRRDPSEADVAQVVGLYDEDILYQDDMLGVLLDRLGEMGLDQRTVVVVLSDHGEELHDHGDWEHGERLFEELIRVPLVILVPGARALAGRRVSTPVQIVDVMPTLLRWFGLPGAEECQGRDLTPLADGGAIETRTVFCEEAHPVKGYDLLSWARGGWKIIRRRPRDDAAQPVVDQVFDLFRDPRERRDLAAVEPHRLARLQRRLERAERRLGEPVATAARPPVHLDARTRRQLEALGYIGSSVPPRP